MHTGPMRITSLIQNNQRAYCVMSGSFSRVACWTLRALSCDLCAPSDSRACINVRGRIVDALIERIFTMRRFISENNLSKCIWYYWEKFLPLSIVIILLSDQNYIGWYEINNGMRDLIGISDEKFPPWSRNIKERGKRIWYWISIFYTDTNDMCLHMHAVCFSTSCYFLLNLSHSYTVLFNYENI